MCRIPLTVVIALTVLAALGATPASAVSDPDNFESTITSIDPPADWLDVEIVDHGNTIRVTNTSNDDIVVLGNQSEPYLRIGPEGTFENTRSPSTYLNRTRQGDTVIPGSADPEADPEWSKVSDEPTAEWHDHRIHWMGSEDPPSVEGHTDGTVVIIPDWMIELETSEGPVDIHGRLVWTPPPPDSGPPWLAIGALVGLVTVVVTALFLLWRARRPSPAPD